MTKKSKIMGPLYCDPESWTCEDTAEASFEQIEKAYLDFDNFPLYWGEISTFTISNIWKMKYSEVKKIYREYKKRENCNASNNKL